VFLGTSDVDEWVPEPRVRETASVMTGLGARVTLEVYLGMGHVVCEDEIRLARRLIQAAMAAAESGQ
jgi:predicted esterase